MDHQYRGYSARNMYSNYDKMRAYAECSPNQSKKFYLIDLFIEQSTKLPEDSGRVVAVSVSEIYQSIVVPHAYKMVITTVCVQIDNVSVIRA